MAGFAPPGVSALLDLFGSSWQDRLKEAAYTSPKGTRIRFQYESVSRETEKRTTSFDFPGVNDSYVQDNGHGSRRYQLRCFFTGKTCDLQATAFEAAVLERGIGKLEHPLYGTFDVVPFGTITRRDDLKEAANQAIVEVTFWSTVGAIYPQSSGLPSSEILSAIEGFDVAAAQDFSSNTNLSTVGAALNAKAAIKNSIRKANGSLSDVASSTSKVNREFRDAQRTVDFGLDVLIEQPLALSRQITALVTAPGRALAAIEARLAAYADLLDDLFASPAGKPADALAPGNTIASRKRKVSNEFHITRLFAMSAVAGSVVSVVNNTFLTKPAALAAAEEVLEQHDATTEWGETGFDALEQPDTGGSYQAIQQAVALTLGFLIQVSFTLVPERRIVLDRPRTIIDLAAELYGSVDDRLDFLIDSNNLTGSEILELPRGRSILYYP